MEKYITVLGESVSEYTEKRSKFIATIRHCDTEEDALEFIDEMKSKYWDARHNVYAYKVGNAARFSDDGEPHGTAGKPVFDVITGDGITNLAVVVTRYFGGVLLGTGGLVRAYSKASKDALLSAQKAEMIPCKLLETECEYTDHAKLLNLIENAGGVIEDSVFTDKVVLKYSLRDGDCEDYIKKLSENFSARLEANQIGRKTAGFKIN